MSKTIDLLNCPFCGEAVTMEYEPAVSFGIYCCSSMSLQICDALEDRGLAGDAELAWSHDNYYPEKARQICREGLAKLWNTRAEAPRAQAPASFDEVWKNLRPFMPDDFTTQQAIIVLDKFDWIDNGPCTCGLEVYGDPCPHHSPERALPITTIQCRWCGAETDHGTPDGSCSFACSMEHRTQKQRPTP